MPSLLLKLFLLNALKIELLLLFYLKETVKSLGLSCTLLNNHYY